MCQNSAWPASPKRRKPPFVLQRNITPFSDAQISLNLEFGEAAAREDVAYRVLKQADLIKTVYLAVVFQQRMSNNSGCIDALEACNPQLSHEYKHGAIAPNNRESLFDKTSHEFEVLWSGRLDLNQRPQRPERCALPG